MISHGLPPEGGSHGRPVVASGFSRKISALRGMSWQIEIVLHPGADARVAASLEERLDVGSLPAFVIVLDGKGAERVFVERQALQLLEFRPFDVEAHEMDE